MAEENKASPAERGSLGGDARAAKLSTDERKQIAQKAAQARWAKTGSAKSIPSNELTVSRASKPSTPDQGVLDLGIERQLEVDGVGMGVLSDGTPFLTGRGLARLCGVHNSVIFDLSSEWNEPQQRARIAAIKDILLQRGVRLDAPYLAITQRSGVFYAYSDALCLAVLEYYAFDAGGNIKEHAQKNYRLLARQGFKNFIYTAVGYDPSNAIPEPWRQFHDRVSLTYNSVPRGYFGIFKEMADMIVTLGQQGLHITSKFVPDISVGSCWSKHWAENNFDAMYGGRIKFEHNYPDYFPQARSNPQEPWCYPEAALGEFRRWLREVYIKDGKFQKYLLEKVKHQELPPSFAQLAIAAYSGEGEP